MRWTWALFLGAFAAGCTEFVVVGLVSQIAVGLDTSEAAVGQLVTVNAVAVVVAAPGLTAALAAVDRRTLLIGAMLVFAATHLASAATSSFALLLALRLAGGAAFGAYMATALGVAGRLAPAERRARAIGMVVAGLTASTALGAPIGTALGRAAGWQAPFVAIGLLALAAAVGIRLLLPAVSGVPDGGRGRWRVMGDRRVMLTIAIIVVFWAGSFAAYTYVVPLLERSASLGHDVVAAVLLAAGLMAVAGNVLGAWAADRRLVATLLWTAAGTAASLGALWALRGVPAPAVALVALGQLAAWSFVPAIQALLFEAGGEVAMTFSVSAFNLGIILGAGAGGAALDLGGLGAVMAVATLLGVAALAMVAAVTAQPRLGSSTP